MPGSLGDMVRDLGLGWLARLFGRGGLGGFRPSAVPSHFTLVAPSPAFLHYVKELEAGHAVPDYAPLKFDPGSVATALGRKLPAPPVAPGLCSFPASYDLRTLGRVTPARDATCGSCWTFAAIGSLESFLAPAEIRDFSEAHMQLRNGADDAACDQGANYEIATFYLAAWKGPVNEADFDPTVQPQYAGPGAAPVRKKYAAPIQKHVQDVYFLPDRKGPLDNFWIKTAVTNLGGIYSSVSRAVFSPYLSIHNTYYHPTSPSVHAVTIVGWNDNFDRNLFYCGDPSVPDDQQVPPGDGAFIVKDDGGPDWGDNGYIYVSYYDGSIGTSMAAFTAEPLGNYDRIYQYDPDGPLDILDGQGIQYSWQGNVFTAVADEALTAVSFYELWNPSMDYQVRVYLDPTNGPAGGTLAATTDVSMWVLGYRTVKLPQKVVLHKGQRFGVVLRGHDRYGGLPSPFYIETPDAMHTKVKAGPGESFVSTDGQTWQDLTTVQIGTKTLTNANVCIKAFTRSLVTLVANLDPANLTWTFTNNGSKDEWVKPVAHERINVDGVFQDQGEDIFAATFQVGTGDVQTTLDGWILVPSGTTVTARPPDGSIHSGVLVRTRYSVVDPYTGATIPRSIWKHFGELLATPLHVVSTDPASGALVNYLGLSMITVTFDATIKAGLGLQGITVTSPSETKSIVTYMNGNQLQIFTSTPLGSTELGGTIWSVHLPADAVLSQTLGNPLAQDCDWSFRVTGVD
jgi:C1A family cysteine protease